jgi:hypothetical protein
MKKNIVLIAAIAMTAGLVHADIVVAGWNSWTVANGPISGVAPNDTATGWTGTMGTNLGGGGGQHIKSPGSADGTYGTAYVAPADPTDSAVQLATYNNNIKRLDFQITNNTGSDQTLTTVHFDFGLTFTSTNTAAPTIQLTHLQGNSDLVAPWGGYAFTPALPVTFGYDGADVDLAAGAMTDFTLAPGESAAFRLELGVTEGAAIMRVDNIAIAAIPEPATFGLIAAFGGALLAIRRKLMV